MINFKDITTAIETILQQNLDQYTIVRNAQRNMDANLAAMNKGWVGIYRDSIEYSPHTVGGVSPYLAEISVTIEIQVASMLDGQDAEDRLQNAEEDVIDILNANKQLAGTVSQNMGYTINYEFNADESIWHHSSIITAKYEVRA